LDDLCDIDGIGRDKAIALKSAFTLASRIAMEFQDGAPLLDTPELVADYLRDVNQTYKVEQLQVVLLNSRRKLIKVELIAHGLVDSLLVHPREVFGPAIAARACAVVLVHNHPSGDPTPSEADLRVTRDLIRAGQLLKIEVADHVILGHRTAANSKGYVSLREKGLFYDSEPAWAGAPPQP
jgi:DNA repair protein RadC